MGARAGARGRWPEHERGGGGRSTSVAVAGARARGGGGRTKGRRRPEHEQWGRAVRRPGGTATSVAATSVAVTSVAATARRAPRTAAAAEIERRSGETEGARVGSAR
jgi:hypothetical protein